jgi:hydroxyacyl-ACP dehydratase HTD2-like protein with hotdog domain
VARIDQIHPGDALPEREFKVDNVELFLYNAVLWNAHRIHFDYPYATEVEGYPGLVIAGPQMGDWLSQCVTDWLGEDGDLESLEYRNRKAAYIGDVLYSGGAVTAVDAAQGRVTLKLFIRNQKGEEILPGDATVRFPRRSV